MVDREPYKTPDLEIIYFTDDVICKSVVEGGEDVFSEPNEQG